MTALLLDTHVILWAVHDPERLSAPARDALEDTRHSLLASAASAWELATKHRLGKLPGGDPVVANYARHLRRLGAEEVPITGEDALLAGGLDWEHRDPFDRMMSAQAMLRDAVLVTRDPAFSALAGLRTLW